MKAVTLLGYLCNNRYNACCILGDQTRFYKLPEAKYCIARFIINVVAGVAQSVRASVCGTEGRGFKSHHSPQEFPRIRVIGSRTI